MRGYRPQLITQAIANLPATDSVDLSQGLRLEGLWVDGRWVWSLWRDGTVVLQDPQAKLGSYAAN